MLHCYKIKYFRENFRRDHAWIVLESHGDSAGGGGRENGGEILSSSRSRSKRMMLNSLKPPTNFSNAATHFKPSLCYL